MRALITRVSGFVGSHLVEDLIRSGFEVFGVAEIEGRRLLEESLWDKISFFPKDPDEATWNVLEVARAV